MADTVIDLATRAQVYLERLKSGLSLELASFPAQLRAKVREIFSKLDVDTLDQLSRAELNMLLVRLSNAHVAITGPRMASFIDGLNDVAEFSAGLEVAQIASLNTGLLPQIRFAAPTAGLAYKRALRTPIQATGDLLEDFVKNWPEVDAMRINKTVRIGWAQGRTSTQMINDIVGTKKNNYSDGQLDISRRHAATIVNTSTQHVANSARQEVWEKNSDVVIGYHWLATLDRRTTTQCKSLEELYGSGKDYFKPGQGPVPPIHPNCRSTTIAKFDSKYDFLDDGATRASSGTENKEVDANLTYYSWLKSQPASFQNTALGVQRATLFRKGGLSAKRFAELNLDRNFKPLTLQQMRTLEPDAFRDAGI